MNPAGPRYIHDAIDDYTVAPLRGPECALLNDFEYPDSDMQPGPIALFHEPSSLFAHRDRQRPVILENDDERCTFKMTDGVGGEVLRLEVERTRDNYGSSGNSWRNVTAFISTHVHASMYNSRHADAPYDKWVVKVVYQTFQNRNNPQTKDVVSVFECRYSECRQMRTNFIDWVLARGFDILFDDYYNY